MPERLTGLWYSPPAVAGSFLLPAMMMEPIPEPYLFSQPQSSQRRLAAARSRANRLRTVRAFNYLNK
jgi:hypothetical protein